MPGPWVAVSSDFEGWQGTSLHEGDYVEFCCYDTSHCRQGKVLGRMDRLAEKTRTGGRRVLSGHGLEGKDA